MAHEPHQAGWPARVAWVAAALGLVGGAGTALAAPRSLGVGARLRLEPSPLVAVARVKEALARREDPLATDVSLHVWVQDGRVLARADIYPREPYCRCVVDPQRLAAAADAAPSWSEVPIAGAVLVVGGEPASGGARQFRAGSGALAEEAESGGAGVGRAGDVGVRQGRAVRLPIAEAPDVAVTALVCFQPGRADLGSDVILGALRRLVTVEEPVAVPPPARRAPVGSRTPLDAFDDGGEERAPPRRDALERYVAEREARPPPHRAPRLVGMDSEILAAAESRPAPAIVAPLPAASVFSTVELCQATPGGATASVRCRVGERVTRTFEASAIRRPSAEPGEVVFASTCRFGDAAETRATLERELLRLARGERLACTERVERCLDPRLLTDEERARRREPRGAGGDAGVFVAGEELPLCAEPVVAGPAPPAPEPVVDRDHIWTFGRTLGDSFAKTRRCPRQPKALDFELVFRDARMVRRLNTETRALEVASPDIPRHHRRGAAHEPLATACEYRLDGGPVHVGRMHCHGTSCFEDRGDDLDCTLYGSAASAPELWRPVRSCERGARATDHLYVVSASPDDDVFMLVRYFKYSKLPSYGVLFAPPRARP